jgi:hypothetical protein
LGAVRRQSHGFDVYSRPGLGTAVLARLSAGRPSDGIGVAPWGGVCLAKAGEEVCGDGWAALIAPDGEKLLVVDGLGHGSLAAEAANTAVRIFQKHSGQTPTEIVERLHDGLRPTRGAAVAVTRVDRSLRRIEFVGIGNIAGTLIAANGTKKMVSLNGTAGHVARKFQAFSYPFDGAFRVILHSDGIGTSWSLDRYPGLAQRHPSLISAILYRDFARGRDDATVATLAGSAP